MEPKNTLGLILVIFVGVIFALAVLPAILTETGQGSKIYTANLSVTIPANGSNTNILGREVVTTNSIINGSEDTLVNLSLINGYDSDGELTVQLHRAGMLQGNYTGEAYVNYDYKSFGYDDTSGGRAMLNLLLVMVALAIMVFAIPGVREFMKDNFSR